MPRMVSPANTRKKPPLKKPSILSEMYFDARAAPVTASSVARACPRIAPAATPAKTSASSSHLPFMEEHLPPAGCCSAHT